MVAIGITSFRAAMGLIGVDEDFPVFILRAIFGARFAPSVRLLSRRAGSRRWFGLWERDPNANHLLDPMPVQVDRSLRSRVVRPAVFVLRMLQDVPDRRRCPQAADRHYRRDDYPATHSTLHRFIPLRLSVQRPSRSHERGHAGSLSGGPSDRRRVPLYGKPAARHARRLPTAPACGLPVGFPQRRTGEGPERPYGRCLVGSPR